MGLETVVGAAVLVATGMMNNWQLMPIVAVVVVEVSGGRSGGVGGVSQENNSSI